ncbi:WD40 repeat-like protein [Saitoella complicata NRRL Y-17804]|uniref:Uncharacterized protein n=1 Tax=Saitoella complicata (strain BCRC 22490 / CBS 7301 / JCM 7358 / NBRC 10748 / NRRL Y-17804) TaxID=698492 RepID=A0A0E9NCD9_SAICN|nr:WD40 repeat-like protein [Saitoella complicata NRRL Y-17804]ODQ52584.1 WD40 repeat-like protein [Saitoella complicata NRRL Y-17804]GAO47532.1 hypothetical protein G7K_1737-t1 [Saitoella complicata NRRL Y-17804]
MPRSRLAEDSPHAIIAAFLEKFHYTDTLDAFRHETGLGFNDGPKALDLEELLGDRRMREMQATMHATHVQDALSTLPSWSAPSGEPVKFRETACVHGAVLNAMVVEGMVWLSYSDGAVEVRTTQSLDSKNPDHLKVGRFHPHGRSPVLSMVVDGQFLITGGMDGRILVTDVPRNGGPHVEHVQTVAKHGRYVVRLAMSSDKGFLVSASYDNTVKIFCRDRASPACPVPAWKEERTITFATQPEALHITEDNEVIMAARSSNLLQCIKLYTGEERTINLNAVGDDHVSFSPLDIAPHPQNPNVLAIATLHPTTPFHRVVFLDLSQSRVIGDLWTDAPQNEYSTPRVVWRGSGDGIWVNGDDGVLRGYDVSTKRKIGVLAGHEGNVKAVWAGTVEGREVVVTGGFDKTVRLWW